MGWAADLSPRVVGRSAPEWEDDHNGVEASHSGQAVRKVREGGRMLGYRSHQSLGGLTPPPTLTTGRPTSTNHHQ